MSTTLEPVDNLARPNALDADLLHEGSLTSNTGPFAPMIRNAWYAVGLAKEIGRELTGIKVIGERLVFYRTEAGETVVLDDRCAHRRFLLSKSKLIGDTIQCGYHGFTYEPSGACIYAPGLTVKPKFGVKRYPAVEKGAWLWVWMGDSERADPATIPLPDRSAGGPWYSVEGYTLNPANYMLVIENLLDITHLHFLHGPQIQDRAYAEAAPKSIDAPRNGVGHRKEMPCTAVSNFANFCGGNAQQMVRQVDTVVQAGPSLTYASQERFALAGDSEPIHPQCNLISHCLTPADESSTHQFWQFSFNSPLQVETSVLRDVISAIFSQDKDVLDTIQTVIKEDHRVGNHEVGIPSDRFGVKMRNILRKMKQAEQ